MNKEMFNFSKRKTIRRKPDSLIKKQLQKIPNTLLFFFLLFVIGYFGVAIFQEMNAGQAFLFVDSIAVFVWPFACIFNHFLYFLHFRKQIVLTQKRRINSEVFIYFPGLYLQAYSGSFVTSLIQLWNFVTFKAIFVYSETQGVVTSPIKLHLCESSSPVGRSQIGEPSKYGRYGQS